MQYIAYYRVSTKQQGRSGLGLEAQQQAVKRFLKADDTLLQQYIEVETGKRNDRPQLQQAMQQVIQTGATLLIAKLDRLSRNASFILQLRDSGVPFIAADMPDANHLTVGLIALLADHERQLISDRTKAALQALKARGKQLGTAGPDNLTDEHRVRAWQARKDKAYNHPSNRQAGTVAQLLRKQGQTFAAIAQHLNEHGFKTRNNKQFTPAAAQRLILRYDQKH